ncbi:uncharacterized protein Dana_GF16394 [Drosophila ananassae]|uniref:Uncharacterized protein n=1 Tax=Drosophila ananassae TaxID=7217 RepID=B3LVT3_DROAN|nr:uncharacterized protein LOC6499190 [Drosophila ananassae]EDV43707.1 uncharacterized protein Dana_GF16394 [Drosophila ananassae]
MKLKSRKQEPVGPQKTSSKSTVGSLSAQGTERVYTEVDSEGRLVSRPLTPYECKLEDDVEQLQEALFTISSHYAKIQFRLRQISSASCSERNCLLEELQRMTTQGLDGCNPNQAEELPNLKCDSLSLGNVRFKQQKIINQLRESLQDLAEAAGACFEADYKAVGDGPEYVEEFDSSQQIELCPDKKETGGQYLQEVWSDADYGNEELRWPIEKPRRLKNKSGKSKGRSRRSSNISKESQKNKISEKLKRKPSKSPANQDSKVASTQNTKRTITPLKATSKSKANVAKRFSQNILNSLNSGPNLGMTVCSCPIKIQDSPFTPLRRTQSISQYSGEKSRNSLTSPSRHSGGTIRELANSVLQRSVGAITRFSGARTMTLHPPLLQTQSTMPFSSLSKCRTSIETAKLRQGVGRSSDRKIHKCRYKRVASFPSQSDDYSQEMERNAKFLFQEGPQRGNIDFSGAPNTQRDSLSNTSESSIKSLNIRKSCPWKFVTGPESTETSERSES